MCETRLTECINCMGTGMVDDWYDNVWGDSIPIRYGCDSCNGEGSYTERKVVCTDCKQEVWVSGESNQCSDCIVAEVVGSMK